MLAQVNAHRAAAGAAPVNACTTLREAASHYAAVLADWGQLSHTGPDGSTLRTRVAQAGYRDWRYLGENLASGHRDVTTVVLAWLESPGHRENLLSGSATHVGFGAAERLDGSSAIPYWVQVFGAGGTC